MIRPSIVMVAGAWLVGAALVGPAGVMADTLTTTTGKVYEGNIIRRDADGSVLFEITSGDIRGRIVFSAERIATLEEGETPAERQAKAYQEQRKALDLTTAEGWYRLGEWCAQRKMYANAVEAFQESVTRDKAYRVKGTLARARMEIDRGRPRAARDLLEPLAKSDPDNPAVKAEVNRVQQRLNAEVKAALEAGRRAYGRKDTPLALALFRRVVLEADAALLAEIGRDLAAKGQPSLAATMVNCRLSDALIDKPATFKEVTPLEGPLLLERTAALVDAGTRSSSAAYGQLAAMTGEQTGDRLAPARRELAGLDRLARLAQTAEGLARDLGNEAVRTRMSAAARALTLGRAKITLLMVEAIQYGARKALAATGSDEKSFGKRERAADAAAKRVSEGQKALVRLAARHRDLPPETAALLLKRRKEFDDLERRLRDERGHLKRIEVALDRGLRASSNRDYRDAALWLGRLVKEASDRERDALERIVRKRTGDELLDLMLTARIKKAEKDGRFEWVTDYERDPLDRELARQASRASLAAADDLRTARAAPPDSSTRRRYARRAIQQADAALLLLRGRLDIGTKLSRRERRRIDDDIDDVNDTKRAARRLR